MDRYAPFHRAREGDTTFLNDRSNISAPKKLLYCEASKIYVYKHVYDHMLQQQQQGSFDMSRLVASSNPRLAFMKELINNKMAMGATIYRKGKLSTTVPRSTRIHAGAYVHYTTIGKNCTVLPCTTIGYPALATERDEYNRIYRFPHIGICIIGDNVWIGAQCNISRGSLGDTTIGDNVTIDDHVHIAHNCHIGENTIVTAGVTIGGSVTIGSNCWIGLGSTISDHLTIGNNVLIGVGAAVIDDVEDRDIVGGVPARSIKDKCQLSDYKLYQMVGYTTAGKT